MESDVQSCYAVTWISSYRCSDLGPRKENSNWWVKWKIIREVRISQSKQKRKLINAILYWHVSWILLVSSAWGEKMRMLTDIAACIPYHCVLSVLNDETDALQFNSASGCMMSPKECIKANLYFSAEKCFHSEFLQNTFVFMGAQLWNTSFTMEKEKLLYYSFFQDTEKYSWIFLELVIGDLYSLAGKWKATPFYIWLNKVLEVTVFNSQNRLVISILDDPLKLAEDNEFIHHLWLSVLSPACTQDNSILEWRVLTSLDKSNIPEESHFTAMVPEGIACPCTAHFSWSRPRAEGQSWTRNHFMKVTVRILAAMLFALWEREIEIEIGVFLSLG